MQIRMAMPERVRPWMLAALVPVARRVSALSLVPRRQLHHRQ